MHNNLVANLCYACFSATGYRCNYACLSKLTKRHGKTKFNHSWLEKTDCNGHLLRTWCAKDSSSDFAGYCLLCKKTIQCGNNGAVQILHHAEGQKHKDIAKMKISTSSTQMFQRINLQHHKVVDYLQQCFQGQSVKRFL